MEPFALLPFSCRHVWHRFIGCLPLELFTLSFSSSSRARDLQHITWRLRFCPLKVSIHCTWRLSSARGRATTKIWTLLRVIIWVICASHGTCVATPQRVLCNLDIFLKTSLRRRVSKMSACQRGRFSCRTRDADSNCFRTEITRSSCN